MELTLHIIDVHRAVHRFCMHDMKQHFNDTLILEIFTALIQTSSRLKSTPPIGAPNATDTPTAEAADKT